jgi:fatty-acyl-CoA synthase
VESSFTKTVTEAGRDDLCRADRRHFDWIRRHAERTPDKLALVDAAQRAAVELCPVQRCAANRWRAFMQRQLGLRQGDRVSILAQNSGDYFEVLFACGKMGVILNTLNWRLAAPELAYILNDCTPRAVDLRGGLCRRWWRCGRIGLTSSLWCWAKAPAGEWEYEKALASRRPAVSWRCPRLTYDDTWAILYTSGTTGRPKGAQVTYGNFFYNAVGMGQAIDLTANDVNLNVLPTFHAGGLGLYAGPTFHAGGTVVVMRAFDPAAVYGAWRSSGRCPSCCWSRPST